MKFTFKKHKLKVLMIDLIIIILFFGIVYFYSLENLFIAYCTLSVGGICLLPRMLYYYFLLVRFLKKHSKEEKEEIERELSNVLLRYSDCFLTENYIFGMKRFIYIKYDEIVCLTPSIITIIDRGISGFGKKSILYLKNGTKYVIRIGFFTTSYHFVRLIKKKNPDVFIGNIKDYKREKENIEYLKELRSRTKLQ